MTEGIWRDERHRYFYGDRGPFPSVTTLISILDKSGPLVGWAKRETAACAIRNHDMIDQLIASGGKEAAEKWLASIPDYQRDQAGDLGSRVHALAEKESLGQEISPTGIEVPYVRAWRKFISAIRPEITHVECPIINLDLGFGGTFDLGAKIDGVATLLDIKTGARVYYETSLQLAGYAIGQFTTDPGSPDQIALPEWERFGVVHLQPDEWELIPVEVGQREIDAFKRAADLWHWNRERGPWLMGSPITEDSLQGAI